ncbi:MAG: hypothetical protein C4346_18135 [Chloroflexota bacterium]
MGRTERGSSSRRQTSRWVHARWPWLPALLCVMAVLAGGGVALAGPGSSIEGAGRARLIGETRAAPIPLQTEGQAGPWRLTVVEVVTGDQAAQLVTSASSSNPAPTDGFQYVAVRLRAANAGDRPLPLSTSDFGVTGASGLVWRFLDVTPPDPALEVTVAPGKETEGWVVASVPSTESKLVLMFDSTTLGGNWADRYFMLEPGATIPAVESRPVKLNRIGRTASEPAAMGETVATRDWAVQILEVLEGQAVYDLYPAGDYRTTALADSQGGADIPLWLAFRIRVTNNRTGNSPAFFPPLALQLADSQGQPLEGALTLTPPDPDASGFSFPGATREGWVVFEQPANARGSLLRLQPFATDTDVRYLSWGAVNNAPASLDVGATVTVTEDAVRMRSAPSTSADIVTELARGTRLVVTGAPEEADGFTWYPVENPETGQAGYVAADFLQPASG